MKGLIAKDLLLIRQQLPSVLIVVICGIFMAFSFEPQIVIGYIAMVSAMTVAGTVGYDEYQNGLRFLFTLPVSKKTYVYEKYLLTMAAVFISGLLASCIAYFITAVIRHDPMDFIDLLTSYVMMTSVILIMCGVTLLVRIHFGSEKGRIIQFVIYGILLVALLLGTKIISLLNIKVSAPTVLPHETLPIVLIGAIIIFMVMEKITAGLMEKKEF
jgi:hypothetical protein